MPVLSLLTLNRTLLARQFLLRRETRSVADTLEHLVGMQAQIPDAPYIGLWSRLAGFRPGDLSDLVTSRQAVRMALMRNTLHLVTADDCLALRPVVQRLLARAYAKANPDKLKAIVEAGRLIVEAQPRTNVELGRLLLGQFPGYDAITLGYAIRNHAALVQLPPRGVWGQRGAAVLTTAESWIGRPLSSSSAAGDMIRRYLTAFGPATVADMTAWSGLPGLKEDVERLRSTLRVVHDDRGRELFDVPHGVWARASTAAPVRFLPEYDNVLVAYADRSRIVPDEHRQRSMRQIGWRVVLVDGFARAFWRLDRCQAAATLDVELLDATAVRAKGAIEREGQRLLAFVAPDARTTRVRCSCARL